LEQLKHILRPSSDDRVKRGITTEIAKYKARQTAKKLIRKLSTSGNPKPRVRREMSNKEEKEARRDAELQRQIKIQQSIEFYNAAHIKEAGRVRRGIVKDMIKARAQQMIEKRIGRLQQLKQRLGPGGAEKPLVKRGTDDGEELVDKTRHVVQFNAMVKNIQKGRSRV
jgi:hypothetical protein